MINAHCNFPMCMTQSFSPIKVAQNVYIPSDKNGILSGYKGDNFDWLPRYNTRIMVFKKKVNINKAQEIMSFTGLVWLIGTH